MAVPDFEGICANAIFVLEPKDPNVLLPELLPFIMQSEVSYDHSIKQSKGSVNPYVNLTELAGRLRPAAAGGAATDCGDALRLLEGMHCYQQNKLGNLLLNNAQVELAISSVTTTPRHMFASRGVMHRSSTRWNVLATGE